MGGDRPGIGGGNRPVIGGDRPGPGAGTRPNAGNRPVIDGGNNFVNRPGGNNNFNRPGGNNNFVNINNRAGWGGGYWGGGHWGGNYGNWAGNWHDHHINHWHDGWYHGCWGGHWGNNWYVPLAYGAAAWGVNALLPAWGYGYGYNYYSNPYYAVPTEVAQPVYDYSQPIVINTYNTPEVENMAAGQAPTQQVAQDSPQQTEGYQIFDQARQTFMTGDYRTALRLDEQAIQKVPHDPVLHEFGALCLFALGDYDRAAGVLNSLLAVAPGMDWTTMSALYPNVEVYTQQLRALETYCRQKPRDPAAQFVLAYQYLVAGHSDAAAGMLKNVVALQPGDMVAKQILEALSPQPAEQTVAAQTSAPAAFEAQPAEAPSTDLVGRWRAERDGSTFELSIDEQGQFNWRVIPKGKQPIAIGGNVTATSDVLVLESKDQGSMVGHVTSGGPDQFQFVSTGGPPDDKGLSFQRVKQNS
jgi:tetratricopeptide (TPR) repeat protein